MNIVEGIRIVGKIVRNEVLASGDVARSLAYDINPDEYGDPDRGSGTRVYHFSDGETVSHDFEKGNIVNRRVRCDR